MTTHLEQKRYSAVIGSDGQIYLRGVLDESSSFDQTIELIQERHKKSPEESVHLNFTYLASGSWNGFLKLDKLLSGLNLNFILRHVSLDLFRYVALLPTLRKAKLGEIELSVVSTGSSTAKIQLSGDDAVAVSTSGRFASIGGQQIVGRHSFIFGDKVERAPTGSGKTEFDAWYDYIAFASITMALAEDLARSIAMSVIRLSGELALEYRGQAISMQIIKHTDKAVLAREAESEAKILNERAGDSESVFGHIILSIKKIVTIAENIQQAMHKVEGDKREPVLEAVQEIRKIRKSLLEIVQLIESGGSETLSLLVSVPGREFLEEAYIAASTPDAHDLAAIREAFSIMDPMSEDDWEETKVAIFERTQNIEQLITNLVVLTQGFDLLRQIIEHRIAEIGDIEEYLDRGAPLEEFEAFKKILYERIKRKLVTDQEKLSADAFMPEVLEENWEEARKPGEILLF